LVNRVVPAASLADETSALAARLAAGPTRSYAHIRRLLRQSWTATLAEQLDAERDAFCASAATEDFKEGITAFFEKRGANFHGR
ncbi:enoyl-CoA hydratase-related protein, partial [Azospirillum sp.]|uniref:enoyl-CoA hydratase-related protein n=1 Tax=Azospirillum sp. TaxID=34012 RepID=UPI002D45CF1C